MDLGESPFHLRQEALSLLQGRIFDGVQRQPELPAAERRSHANAPLDHSLARVAEYLQRVPRERRRGDGCQEPNAAQPSSCDSSTFRNVEGHAREPGPIEPSLEHGGEAEEPGWEDEDQPFGALDARDVARHRAADRFAGIIQVVQPFAFSQQRVESFGVEVEEIDVVTVDGHSGEYALEEGVAERVGVGVGVDDEEFHDGSVALAGGGWVGRGEIAGGERC